jgi:hypothetical protein
MDQLSKHLNQDQLSRPLDLLLARALIKLSMYSPVYYF